MKKQTVWFRCQHCSKKNKTISSAAELKCPRCSQWSLRSQCLVDKGGFSIASVSKPSPQIFGRLSEGWRVVAYSSIEERLGAAVIIGIALIVLLIIFAISGPSLPRNNVATPRSEYEDMRARGHSEEDAVIVAILKQQGYSDYDAIRAMQSSKNK